MRPQLLDDLVVSSFEELDIALVKSHHDESIITERIVRLKLPRLLRTQLQLVS